MTKSSQAPRRQALQLMGAASVLALTGREAASGELLYGAAAAACRNDIESTAGPYPNIDPLERRDLRANSRGNTSLKPGAQLTLRIRVHDIENACAPIPGAVVDIWGADAVGTYAGYAPFNTVGQDFCRGYQRTDANGQAEFLTLFPGSYTGRALHIHFSIQSQARNLRPNDDGRNLPNVFVAQLYFAASTADEVFASNPIYQQGARRTPNEADSIYLSDGGSSYIVTVTKTASGYVGEIDVGVKKAAIGMGTPSTEVPLTPGVPVAVSLAAKQTRLYSIKPAAGARQLQLRLSGGSGDGDLFLRANAAPTPTLYDRKSDGPTNAESITLTPIAAGAKYYVLVQAYAAVSGASLVATVS